MTMKLTIRNEDQQRTAIVSVEDYQIGKVSPIRSDSQDLGPGQSREVWVHASRRVLITENAEARRAPEPRTEEEPNRG